MNTQRSHGTWPLIHIYLMCIAYTHYTHYTVHSSHKHTQLYRISKYTHSYVKHNMLITCVFYLYFAYVTSDQHRYKRTKNVWHAISQWVTWTINSVRSLPDSRMVDIPIFALVNNKSQQFKYWQHRRGSASASFNISVLHHFASFEEKKLNHNIGWVIEWI